MKEANGSLKTVERATVAASKIVHSHGRDIPVAREEDIILKIREIKAAPQIV